MTTMLPILASCTPDGYMGQFIAGSCVAERNKRYVASAKGVTKVYKVHEAYSDWFKVSVWNNKSWFYKGAKKISYFDDNKVFAYEVVQCPDGSGQKSGLTQRLKKIDI